MNLNLKIVSSVKDLNAAVVVLNNNLAGTASVLKRITRMSKDVRKLSDAVRSINTLGRSEKIFDDSASFADSTAGSTSGVKGAQASSAVIKEKASTTTMPWYYTKGGAAKVAGLKGALGIVGAAYAAMPDLGTVAARAAGFYGAATLGGRNQAGLRQAVFSGLAGGITGVGDDAAAAAILTQGMYYRPGTAAFNMRVREIGGAARFLNISNPAAAQALGAIGTGPQSAQLSQYGIFTTDPRTGRDLPFNEIIQQVYRRSYAGRGQVSREQIMRDIRGGFLGADLRRLFPDATQQELAANIMGNIAEGKSTDLATLTGENNPLAAAMRINTSQTSLVERATDPMIKGFEQAATVVEKVNKALEGLPDQLFQFKAILQGINGSNLGPAGNILAMTASSVVSGLTTAVAMRAFLGKGVAGAKGPLNAAKSLGAKALNLVKGYGGKALTALSSGASKLAGGAILGLIPIPANLIPGTPGYEGPDVTGKKAREGTMNGGTTGFGASFGARGGGAAQSPVPGVAPSSTYGQKDNSGIWSKTNNTHKGQDYPMPIGSDVQAAMDGIVFDDAPGYEYGITVQIDHENGYQSLYGHLSKSLVKPGDRVKKGQVIAKSGDTGNVTGPHLHFEVRKGSNNPVDPQQLISAPFSGANPLLTYSTSTTLTSPTKSTTSTSPTNASEQSSSSSTLRTGIQPGAKKQEWINAFLGAVGAPATKDNVYALSEWMRFESGDKWNRWNNPLNTTLNRPGSTSVNKVGVKKYGTLDQGIEATIATLTGNRAKERGYTAILDALKSGADYTQIFDAIRGSAWVGGEEKKSPYKFNYNRGPQGGGRVGFGAGFSSDRGSGTVNNHVTINVQVQQATDEEAMRLARTVKRYLEQDSAMKSMGVS